MTSKYRRHFTKKESEYIRSAAGKVPVKVIAKDLGRKVKSITEFCWRRGLSLKVPFAELKANWPDYVPVNWRKG